jgi:hypothetical protein
MLMRAKVRKFVCDVCVCVCEAAVEISCSLGHPRAAAAAAAREGGKTNFSFQIISNYIFFIHFTIFFIFYT